MDSAVTHQWNHKQNTPVVQEQDKTLALSSIPCWTMAATWGRVENRLGPQSTVNLKGQIRDQDIMVRRKTGQSRCRHRMFTNSALESIRKPLQYTTYDGGMLPAGLSDPPELIAETGLADTPGREKDRQPCGEPPVYSGICLRHGSACLSRWGGRRKRSIAVPWLGGNVDCKKIALYGWSSLKVVTHYLAVVRQCLIW